MFEKLYLGDSLKIMSEFERNNRKFIGIEIDKKYFDIAEKRINEYQGILI